MLGINKAAGCMVDILISGKGKRFFQTSSGADPACSSVRIGILFSGLKWLGCEADHLPPYSSEVKNECSSTPSTIRLCVVAFVLSVLLNRPLNVYASIYNRCVLFPFHLSW